MIEEILGHAIQSGIPWRRYKLCGGINPLFDNNLACKLLVFLILKWRTWLTFFRMKHNNNLISCRDAGLVWKYSQLILTLLLIPYDINCHKVCCFGQNLSISFHPNTCAKQMVESVSGEHLSVLKVTLCSLIWGERMPIFKLDISSHNISKFRLSFSWIKVDTYSPVSGEHMPILKLTLISPIWGEHIPTFKLDVCFHNIGKFMLSFSLRKVGVCSPILGEHMHI